MVLVFKMLKSVYRGLSERNRAQINRKHALNSTSLFIHALGWINAFKEHPKTQLPADRFA